MTTHWMTDFVHVEALRSAAFWFRSEREHQNYGQAERLCFDTAAQYADDGEAECAAVYLRAASSALRIAELEQDAIREAFNQVADEWWATHKDWPSTSYGSPWSPARLDSNPQPSSTYAHTA